jgi:hypothetical protein
LTVEPAGEPGEPDRRRKRDLAWLKDYRVIALSVASAAGAFLIAFLLFIQPWHLKPAVGDLATWMTVLVGAAAATFVLAQLRQQQRAIDEDRKRGRKRDELLDGQLRELADRERDRQREQAEHVALSNAGFSKGASGQHRRLLEESGQLSRDNLPRASFVVHNNSWRPIRKVTARVIVDGRRLQPWGFRSKYTSAGTGNAQWGNATDSEADLAAGVFLNELADGAFSALFTVPWDLEDHKEIRYVVRFYDDAERRWELDQDMHLAPAPDDSW